MINQVINKCKHTGNIISHITIDGLKTYNPYKVANGFGEHYATVRKKLADAITTGSTSIEQYLSKIPRTENSLVLRETTSVEIEKVIRGMPAKTRYGHDKVSNILLKSISTSISYPLEIMFNQSIYYGVFPEKMKHTEIIPLYKGKEYDLVVNYRPISLLMTMSKVLEKIIYHQLNSYLELNGTLYEGQYGFRSK